MKEERGKCEEVIDQNLRNRINDFCKAIELADENPDGFEIDGQDYDDLTDWMNSYVLNLSKTVNYKLELSWGGPQDYFVFEYDPKSQQLVGITYHYLDWFDGAKRDIPLESKKWQIPKSGGWQGLESEEWQILEKIFYSYVLVE